VNGYPLSTDIKALAYNLYESACERPVRIFVISSRKGDEMDRQQRTKVRSFAGWSGAVLLFGLLLVVGSLWFRA
jgi:hypothetical protein